MLDVAVVQAIAGLGATGILIVGIYYLASGRVRSGPLVDADRERLEKDRDGWRVIAEAALAKLAALTAAVVKLTETVAQLREEVHRLRDLVTTLGGKP